MHTPADVLFEHTSDGVLVLDSLLQVQAANGRAALLYRRRVADLQGRRLLHLFPELEGSPAQQQLEAASAGALPVKFELFIPSLFSWHSVLAVPQAGGLLLFCRDISDRVRRERDEAVQAAVRSVVEHVPVGVTITRGPNHRIELANFAARALFAGRAVEGELLATVLPEAREQGFIALLDEVFRSGQAYRGDEMPLSWRSRSSETGVRQGFFDLVYQPLLDTSGQVDGIVHLVMDVTEKVIKRQTIARLAGERQAVLEQLTEGVIATDAQGRITLVNEAAARMHGTAVLDVPPQAYTATYHLLTDAGEPHPVEDLPLSRAVRTRRPVTSAVWRIRRPDGTVLRVRGHAKPVFGTDGSLLACVLTMAPAEPD